MGTILLQMQTSGNMLFREWHAEVQCCPQQQPCIKITFLSLMGKEMAYHGEVTNHLQMLVRSMDNCQNEWRSFVSEMRSTFSLLNHYTSEQLVYLCHWIHEVCQHAPVPPQLWDLLFSIKPHCTLLDIRVAYASASSMSSKHDEVEDAECEIKDQCYKEHMDEKPASPGETEDGMEEAVMLISLRDEDDGVMECDSIKKHSVDSLENLWSIFKQNMAQYLTEYLDITTLGHFLSCLSEMNRQHVVRNLPSVVQEGRPNLVLCPSAEVFTSILSFYMESPEQHLPSTDEVLVCREDTTEEEVEIFLRRALCQGSLQSWKRLYCLVNPGLLGYDVSVALGEFFDALTRSADPHYRLVIISPVTHQHRYVPSFFNTYKVQAGVCVAAETARKYLHHHFTQNKLPQKPVALISPDHLSVWMVSSVRPAVGKDNPKVHSTIKMPVQQQHE